MVVLKETEFASEFALLSIIIQKNKTWLRTSVEMRILKYIYFIRSSWKEFEPKLTSSKLDASSVK